MSTTSDIAITSESTAGVSVARVLLAFGGAAHRRSETLGWLIALAPAAMMIMFVFAIASPMYEAESRFAVRSGEMTPALPGMSGGLGGGMMASGAAGVGFLDGYAACDFLQSRDGMERLETKIDLRAILTRRGIDPFAGVAKDATEDQLFDAYRSAVQVRYYMIEQTVVMQTFAFTPTDAVKMSRALLEVAEDFADQLNRRAREDALRVAKNEVDAGERRASDTRLAMTKWRVEHANVDPTAEVTMLMNVVGQMESELAVAEIDLATLNANKSPDQPRRASVELHVNTLKQRISQLQGRIADTNSPQLGSYEMLKIAQDFADANLNSVRQSLEAAKSQLLRQQKFLSIYVDPRADQRPAYPNKPAFIFGALVVGTALAFIGSVLLGLVGRRLAVRR